MSLIRAYGPAWIDDWAANNYVMLHAYYIFDTYIMNYQKLMFDWTRLLLNTIAMPISMRLPTLEWMVDKAPPGQGANGLGGNAFGPWGNSFGLGANGRIQTRRHQFNILLQYMYLNTANIVEYKLNI